MEAQAFYEKVYEAGLVPVVVIEDPKDAVPTAEALLAGGINTMEITYRTACAGEAIALVRKAVPEMLVGAGTILNVRQAKEAVDQGASFIVSPGFSEEVVRWCEESGIPVVPGCVTPTEIMAALSCGLSVVKYFPANLYGGIKAIRSLAGVFRGLKFMPTGGVNAENLSEFASETCIAAIGGSWVCTASDIREQRFGKITELSREAVGIIKEARK
ncbi:MAG: bifunctional 4-hydroxy-2-oxoglutarate aldolase/2-dehydro-3-deoxy-phosphogluconate aldolase [Clostridiales bacterium]|nr:bifunctional 4-hydroxy-2-oxoglutarate aldolase/2-dehydro-3-deoxy-phosphogluconate aldolase [Clostridiales bacterium]